MPPALAPPYTPPTPQIIANHMIQELDKPEVKDHFYPVFAGHLKALLRLASEKHQFGPDYAKNCYEAVGLVETYFKEKP